MSSAFVQAATILKGVIDTEFQPEGYVAVLDELHESLGRKRTAIGISPVEDVLQPGNDIVQETVIEVKFYLRWKQEISPDTQIDPTTITEYAERFRLALGRASRNIPGTSQLWYFDVRRVSYPRDPTGNKTRFVATVRCKGNNIALYETIA